MLRFHMINIQIDHRILLKKLYLYGVKGNELNWFKDYLSDRSHSTSYLDTLSEPLTLQCGIPQGTILGPLLFIIDINDLPDNCPPTAEKNVLTDLSHC